MIGACAGLAVRRVPSAVCRDGREETAGPPGPIRQAARDGGAAGGRTPLRPRQPCPRRSQGLVIATFQIGSTRKGPAPKRSTVAAKAVSLHHSSIKGGLERS